MRSHFIASLLILLTVVMVEATDRHATTGNYTSQIAAMVPGDTLFLASGTYPNFLIGCGKSSSANPSTIRVENGATVIVTGKADLSGDYDGGDPCTQGQSNLTVTGEHGAGGRGLSFDHQYLNNFVGLRMSSPINNLILKNVEVAHTMHHGMFIGGNNVLVQNIHVHHIGVDANGNPIPGLTSDCGGECHALYIINWIKATGTQLSMTIEQMNIHDVHGWCMTLEAGLFTVRNNIYTNCSVNGNGGGIQVVGSADGGNARNSIVYNNVGYNTGNNSTLFVQSQISVYNNTFYGQSGIYAPDGSDTFRNNILDNTSSNFATSGSGNVFSNNLCNGSGGSSNCQLSGNPGFVSAAGGNFHLNCAGCNSVGTGANLSSVFTTDAEGLQRPGGSTAWDLGAYVLSASQPPPNPDPGTIVADYPFDEGSGTTVADTSVVVAGNPANTGTWSECAGNSCWTTGIIGPYAGNFNGSRYVEVTNTTGMHPTGAIAITAWIKLTGTGVDGCDVASMGDSAKIHVEPNGNVSGQFYDGTTWHEPFSTNVNVLQLPAITHFLGMSYNGTDVRVYLDGNQVAFQAATGAIQYTLGANFQIGRHGNGSPTYSCTGVIDQVSVLNGFCDAGCMMNFYNSQIPVIGMSIAHMGWFATGTPPAQLGATDTDRTSHLITTPLAFGFAVRKADPGSLTEYLKPVCIVNTGAGFPAWTSAVELTNSFAPTGIRYYADAAITQGQATSGLLPTDSFTGVNGLMLKSPIDTTSPYDAAQRLTIAAGQQADMLYEVEFGSPLVGGNSVQCRLVRENGVDFDSYANIKTVTLLGISPPTSVQIGGVGVGGVQQ